MTCRVVAISHATGAGGEEVGRLVAEQLGFLYVDDEIVARAATSGGVDTAEVADEERRQSLAARLLEGIALGGEAWAISGSRTGTQLRSEGIRALIRETIEQTAGRGHVVIVAHGASHVVAPGPDVLRVLVTASSTTRAARLAGQRGLDPSRAAREVKEEDAARRDYLTRFFDIDQEAPTHYDVVVNTDVLSVERAARVVSQLGSG